MILIENQWRASFSWSEQNTVYNQNTKITQEILSLLTWVSCYSGAGQEEMLRDPGGSLPGWISMTATVCMPPLSCRLNVRATDKMAAVARGDEHGH